MKYFVTILLIGLVLFSCRKEEAIDGPSLNDLYGEFAIREDLTPNLLVIDFAADGPFYYTGSLSKNTLWTIDFTGATTGATRVISGTDRNISLDNAAWDGGANDFPGFGLEQVYVEVNFPNEDGAPTIYDTITVTGSKVDAGYLITSFENGTGANWSSFNQATVTGGIVCGDGEAAKGDCYYSWNGTVGWDWAIGSVMVQPDAGTFGLPSSPNNLYMNMAFKALENVGPTNSFILFWIDEDDNGDGTFDESTEDRWAFEYWSDGSLDWELISKKYSDLAVDGNGDPVVTNGNGLLEPAKCVSINVFFLANKDNGNAKAYADHLIFTTNGPYTP